MSFAAIGGFALAVAVAPACWVAVKAIEFVGLEIDRRYAKYLF
jgi:hypothetical protein